MSKIFWFFVVVAVIIWTLIFMSWASILNGQTVEVPKDVAPSIIFAGGVSGAWLSVNRANLKDPNARGYDPCWTYITCQLKPVVKRKGDGWEITFVSDLPGMEAMP